MAKRPPVHNPSYSGPKRTEPERKALYDKNRPNSRQRGYTYKWEKARASHLARYPLCVHCDDNGRVEPATEVDHIIPHQGDMSLFWDTKNWQGLCKSCHSRKTMRELNT